MKAGNTVESLAPVSRDEAVKIADIAVPVVPVAPVLSTEPSDDPFDDENTFDVSRAEFNELRDALIRISERIDAYNKGASHRI